MVRIGVGRLPREVLLAHLGRESLKFRKALAACEPDARVPACPDWDAADLLWHLAEVQWFWAGVVRDRPEAPADDRGYPDRPASYDALLSAFDRYSESFLREMTAAPSSDRAWSWLREQTVAGTLRRQTHEALIHRLDAEQTSGAVTELDPQLAADGVLEFLDLICGDRPGLAKFGAGGGHVVVECTDTGHRIWCRLGHRDGAPGIQVVGPQERGPQVTILGRAADLDAWLWRRGSDSGIEVRGAEAAHDHLIAATSRPIS